ncbi:MAG: acylphosphatase [Pontiella sp.]|nr:acylphosphatase [Pontiella sp.]MBT8045829.1 acylphosphatase [Pontiella sp.]
MKRLHIVFSGRVQGVGFRYAICQIAEPFDVTGFVRNLWDGDVEIVAEGAQQVLADFLIAVRDSRLARYVTGEQLSWGSAAGEYNEFGIAY